MAKRTRDLRELLSRMDDYVVAPTEKEWLSSSIDLSSLERAEPRLLTQRAGRIAFELGYAGVFYHSRYGHSIENWAVFEDWTMSDRFPIRQPTSRKVGGDDPDLLEALRILGLVIGD